LGAVILSVIVGFCRTPLREQVSRTGVQYRKRGKATARIHLPLLWGLWKHLV
jgi:hypothetical protein